jgi:hypothetical protein
VARASCTCSACGGVRTLALLSSAQPSCFPVGCPADRRQRIPVTALLCLVPAGPKKATSPAQFPRPQVALPPRGRSPAGWPSARLRQSDRYPLGYGPVRVVARRHVGDRAYTCDRASLVIAAWQICAYADAVPSCPDCSTHSNRRTLAGFMMRNRSAPVIRPPPWAT